MILTTSKLLEIVKVKAALTTGQAGLTNDNILQIASDVMVSEIVPAVIGKYEGYFLFTEAQPLQAGVSVYRVPERAIGGKLCNLYLRDASGNPFDIRMYSTADLGSLPVTPQNRPAGFYLESNSVRFVPPVGPSPTDSLVMVYYFRPSQLVMESAGRRLVSFTSTTLTLPSIPAGWTTASTLDVVSHRSGNEVVAHDLAISSITGNVITLTSAVTGLEAGQYVTLAGESIVPNLPEDLHILLAEMTVEKLAEIRNDDVRLKQAQGRIQRIWSGLINGMDNRVTSKPEVIVGRSPFFPVW